jgi:hypothetical protein
VLVAIIIGIGFAIMIRDAITSHSVVIDSFDISPNLATQSLTGRIMAAGLVDRLSQIQAATRSSIQKRDISDAWSNEINIEVPETGISVGGIERLLKTRFGHDQHISGDLVKTDPAGLALAVRGAGVLPKTFSDEKGDLDSLLTKAAEYVYSQSQPALWAAYLVDSGRYQEAIDFCQASLSSSSPSDRPVLLTYWGIALAKSGAAGPQALALVQRAVALQRDYWYAYETMPNIRGILGDEEGAWRIGKDMLKVAGGRPARAPEIAYGDFDLLVWDLPAVLGEFTRDAESSSGVGTMSFNVGPQIALVDAWLHDPVAAELALQTTRPDARDPTIAADTHLVRGILAIESGGYARAVSEMEAFLPSYADPVVA